MRLKRWSQSFQFLACALKHFIGTVLNIYFCKKEMVPTQHSEHSRQCSYSSSYLQPSSSSVTPSPACSAFIIPGLISLPLFSLASSSSGCYFPPWPFHYSNTQATWSSISLLCWEALMISGLRYNSMTDHLPWQVLAILKSQPGWVSRFEDLEGEVDTNKQQTNNSTCKEVEENRGIDPTHSR